MTTMEEIEKTNFVNTRFFMLILICFHTERCYSSKFCNHGDIDKVRLPYMEECATGKILLTDTTALIEGDKTTTTPSASNNTQYCLIFEYFDNEGLKTDNQKLLLSTKLKANFSCDHSGICQENGYFAEIKLNEKSGNLFCCSNKDKCNEPKRMPSIPPNQQLCYYASSHGVDGGSYTSEVRACKNPEDLCVSSTITINNKSRQAYFCDRKRCINNGIHQFNKSYSRCKNITTLNQTEELCCCYHNKCNKPPWLLLANQSESTNVKNRSAQKPEMTLLVIGVVTGVAVLVLVIGVICLIVKRNKNKLRALRENAVRMSYKQINADEISNSETAHILYL